MVNTMTSITSKQYFNDDKDKQANTVFTLPLHENDLLVLQEKFVTVGMHEMHVLNFHEGKLIVETILQSLKYYHNIGCISQKIKQPSTIFSTVYYQQHEEHNFLYNLEDFFENNDTIDFLFIEYAQDTQSLATIKSVLQQYHIDMQIPVIIMTYCQ
jgi:hypothetical protein